MKIMAWQYVMVMLSVVGLVVGVPCPSWMRGLEQCNCTSRVPGGLHRTINNVICNDLQHTDHYALQTLQSTDALEKLVYTGNNIRELEANIFGNCSQKTLDHLTYIDLSNNHIEVIHGKSFHCVPNVRTLILNYNRWNVDPNKQRVFSSMPMLNHLELHSAFKPASHQNSNTIHIKDLFNGSSMQHLEELHLEENNIEYIEKRTFCQLPNLYELHLSSNMLKKINFDCLTNLKHLYARHNQITSMDMAGITSFHHMPLLSILDIGHNPYECTDCSTRTKNFRDWLNKQSKFVVDKFAVKCATPPVLEGMRVTELTDGNLKGTCVVPSSYTKQNKTSIITGVILSIIAVLTILFLYVNRSSIKKATSRWCEPIRNSRFMKRMLFGYTTMNSEADETSPVVNTKSHQEDIEDSTTHTEVQA